MQAHDDTIVAIATPPGRGGVAIVRVSGNAALTIAKKITKKTPQPRQFLFGSFYSNHQVIDEGLVLYFKAPHSFTGEDVIEFQAHGAPIVLDELVQLCVDYGARLARPGEFSERAFLNHKMDLTQAEAIVDLINAQSQTAARMAVSSLQGTFSKKINELCASLVHLRVYAEAAMDFPDEDIDFIQDGRMLLLLDQHITDIQKILESAQQGLMMHEGLSLVLVGRPNVGKSTLMNVFAEKDVAIVTDIAGTTRDVRREAILLDDIPLHLVDTAGLRESVDPIEQEGIKRAWSALLDADCVLLMLDGGHYDADKAFNDDVLAQIPKDIPVICIINKIDCLGLSPFIQDNTVYVSLKSGLGVDLLKTLIKQKVGYMPVEGQFMARRRHLDALNRALNLLQQGRVQLLNHRRCELLADDLRRAHEVLGEITGQFSADDLLGCIFSSFCIGK